MPVYEWKIILLLDSRQIFLIWQKIKPKHVLVRELFLEMYL